MPTVGELLRGKRLKSGLELERIAQETKISARLLTAIEEEQFDKLPGSLFTVSFVRQYARALGLDEEPVVAQLRAQQEPPLPVIAAPAPKREPGSSATLLMMAAIALVSLLAFGGVEGWRLNSTPQVEAEHLVQGSADRSAVPEPPRPTAATAQIQVARDHAEPGEAGRAATGLQLVLRAKAPTWVGAKVDGKNVFGGILQPDESKVLENASAVNLVIGNAAGLEISLNGKPIGPVGPPGQVRELLITAPDSVQIRPHHPALQDIF